MIVVADSGPLHYLILLEQTELLHRFYGDVLMPEAVASELRAVRSPLQVRDWMSRAPPAGWAMRQALQCRASGSPQ